MEFNHVNAKKYLNDKTHGSNLKSKFGKKYRGYALQEPKKIRSQTSFKKKVSKNPCNAVRITFLDYILQFIPRWTI